MADKPLSDYPKEVEDYLQSCEQLLAAAASADNFTLSKEQRAVVARYAVEILTAITRPATRKNLPS